MLSLLGRLMGKKVRECDQEEIKCTCGEVVLRVPSENTEIYLCKKCNKLLYCLDPSRNRSNVRPLSLAWLKKR